MKVEKTELEYNEVEEACLRRYLGGQFETLESWAQRVWSMCEAKSLEDPENLGKYEKSLPRVYKAEEGQTWQERAHELWTEKKKKRKDAVGREHRLIIGSDEEIMALKREGRLKTADEMHEENIVRLNR